MEPEIVHEAPPDQEARYIFSALFRGVALSAQQSSAAAQVIGREVLKRRDATPKGGHSWKGEMELLERRTEALRALLTTPEQLRAFDANAAEERRGWEERRRARR